MGKTMYATRIERRAIWPARFWAKVKFVLDSDSCWEWRAAFYRCGYGKFRMPGPRRYDRAAHIVSWVLFFGAIPEGKLVLHKCPIENKKCVRPSHLYLGTKSDNALDYWRGTDRNSLGSQADENQGEQNVIAGASKAGA